MKILVSQLVTKTKIVKRFDVASRVPAWIFADEVCPACRWKIGEDSNDVFSEMAIVAKAGDEMIVVHPGCFEKEKVSRWI